MYLTREEFNNFMKDYNEEMGEIEKDIETNRDHIERAITILEAHQEIIKVIKEKLQRLL